MKIKDVNRLSIEDLLILGEFNFETPELVFGNLKNYCYYFVLDDLIGQRDSVFGMKKNREKNFGIKKIHQKQ